MTTTTVGVARAGAAAWIAALACVAAAQAPDAFVERYKASTKAYATKDYVRMEAELREALKLRPAHPTATYNLAAALALRGDREGAVDTLEQLVDMGLSFDPGADADFAALKDAGGFKAVRRGFARNREPRGQAERAFRLLSPTFIPEGIAYDVERKHFFVGSVHERRIQRVRRDDTEAEFAAPAAGGLWAALGMAADAERRLLWVGSAAVPEMRDADPAELGRSALLAYDLDSGALKHRFEPQESGKHSLGDVAVLDDGTVYASDSAAGLLYRLDAKAGKLVPATAAGALSSPQGLAPDRRGRGLYVADYTQGLFYLEFETGALTRLEVSRGVGVYGIDGLARYEDQLIAIQNGVRPHRVVRLRLDNRGRKVTGASVLASSHKEFDEPTLGVVVGKRFYFVANSQWGKFDAKHKLPPNDRLRRPLVLWLDLEEKAPASPGSRPAPQPAPALPVPCVPPLC